MKNSRKMMILVVAIIMIMSMVAACGQGSKKAEGFSPAGTVNWTVTSSPGGGSDIFSRMIADIMKNEGIADTNIVVTNKTDGGGEIGRNEVAHMKEGDKADNQLLTFNSGDLMPMVDNTDNRAENFKILAVMAVDKQLLFTTPEGKYQDFASVLEAAKNGESIVLAGSKGDDMATYDALLAETAISSDNLKYIANDSTSDAITSALGGHVDLVMSKPAAASEYVEAGDLIPVLALSTERFDGNLADAPTLSEVDSSYKDVEVPVWRGVAAPASMSDEAVKFWTEALQKVSETDTWDTDYIQKNKLIPQYMNHDDATKYVLDFEKNYMGE